MVTYNYSKWWSFWVEMSHEPAECKHEMIEHITHAFQRLVAQTSKAEALTRLAT